MKNAFGGKCYDKIGEWIFPVYLNIAITNKQNDHALFVHYVLPTTALNVELNLHHIILLELNNPHLKTELMSILFPYCFTFLKLIPSHFYRHFFIQCSKTNSHLPFTFFSRASVCFVPHFSSSFLLALLKHFFLYWNFIG